ncbi:MAG: asparagine synthase (glutamine-hydrolyzing) [Flavitalea sp.]
MCGIAGIISANPSFISAGRLQKMTDAIAHRGPEGEAFWISDDGRAAFGHRRLSIIGKSAACNQPMHYLERYVIIHNGEIYNYVELKETLSRKGYIFQSATDTEVILAAYDHYGQKCLELFDGMFAFAIWDKQLNALFCARDRFGEKPFYYYFDPVTPTLYFGSEMKALIAAGLESQADNPLLLQYLAIGHVSDAVEASKTFYSVFKKLPPAHYLGFSFATGKLTVNRYWDLKKDYSTNAKGHLFKEEFAELFAASIGRRLRSDVPLGASLSGGLDSSAILSGISASGFDVDLKTFTAVFPGYEKDESVYAAQAAKHFSYPNFTVFPSAEGFSLDLERLLYVQEEPFSSASVYAQFCVYRLAGEHGVTVLLDGQGADEVFAGYTKYIHWFLQELISQGQFGKVAREFKALRQNGIPFRWGFENLLASFAPSLTAASLSKRETARIGANDFITEEFKEAYRPSRRLYKPVIKKLNDILHYDACRHGLEDLLRYADRNAMAHGREARLPFLSHELASFIFSLPSTSKIHDGWTKWMLRQEMNDRLPSQLTWRKNKIAFEPPQRQWMESEALQEYYQEAIKKLVSEKILKSTVISKAPHAHSAYASDGARWRYLMAGMFLSK